MHTCACTCPKYPGRTPGSCPIFCWVTGRVLGGHVGVAVRILDMWTLLCCWNLKSWDCVTYWKKLKNRLMKEAKPRKRAKTPGQGCPTPPWGIHWAGSSSLFWVKTGSLCRCSNPVPSPDENLKLPFCKELTNGDKCLHTKPGQRGRRRLCFFLRLLTLHIFCTEVQRCGRPGPSG